MYALHARCTHGMDSYDFEGVLLLRHYLSLYQYTVVETSKQRLARLLSTTTRAARCTEHDMIDWWPGIRNCHAWQCFRLRSKLCVGRARLTQVCLQSTPSITFYNTSYTPYAMIVRCAPFSNAFNFMKTSNNVSNNYAYLFAWWSSCMHYLHVAPMEWIASILKVCFFCVINYQCINTPL